MTYLAIMSVIDNRVAKYAEFSTEGEALAHVVSHAARWPDALVAEKPSDNFAEWWFDGQAVTIVPVPLRIPDRVSARQFKLQLLAPVESYPDGLIDYVEAWVATQPRAVQISYADSTEFVRTEPMMQVGFAALGFTDKQIDAFFVAASGR